MPIQAIDVYKRQLYHRQIVRRLQAGNRQHRSERALKQYSESSHSSVSYTHLNEVLRNCVKSVRITDDRINMSNRLLAFLNLMLICTFNSTAAVSYTHLDVYKRQGVLSPSNSLDKFFLVFPQVCAYFLHGNPVDSWRSLVCLYSCLLYTSQGI